MPGGALEAIDGGAAQGRRAHLRPALRPQADDRRVGLRDRADHRRLRQGRGAAVSGPGGHTSRPHMTVDLVYALRQGDHRRPRPAVAPGGPAGRHVAWCGARSDAGTAANAIPDDGIAAGHGPRAEPRCLARRRGPGPAARHRGRRARPAQASRSPTCRACRRWSTTSASTAVLREAVGTALGPGAATEAEQSLGGEDFAWYLDRVPGALARLGVRRPRRGRPVPRPPPAHVRHRRGVPARGRAADGAHGAGRPVVLSSFPARSVYLAVTRRISLA